MTKKPPQTPAHESLAEAFTAAQAEFPVIRKDKSVSFGRTQFRYASLDAIYSACRPVLNAHGLSLSHVIEPDLEGSTLLVKTLLRWHGSEDELESVMPISLQGKTMKDIGAELTYARRYGLSGLLGVAADEDLDALGMEPDSRRQGASQARQGPTGRRSIRDMASAPTALPSLHEGTVKAITKAADVEQMNIALKAVADRPEAERQMYRAIMQEAAARTGAEYDASAQQFVRASGAD